MNGWTKWIGTILVAMGMIGGHMLFVADGRYFPIREGIELAQSYKTGAQIQKENYKAIRALNAKQTDMEKKWLREKNERQKRKMERMEEKIRRLQQRPRAQ